MSIDSEVGFFHAVVEQGSFIGAAKKLGVSSTAVSNSVKKLEARLNVRLLERSTRVVRETHEGRSFYQQSRLAFAKLEESFEEVKDKSEVLAGEIVIAAPTDLAKTRLLGILDYFSSLYPEVRFRVNTSDLVEDLYSGDIDIAIRYGIPSDSRLVARPLSEKRRVLCVSPDFILKHGHIQHPSELSHLPCICYKVRDKTDNEWVFYNQSGKRIQVKVNSQFCTDNSSIAREWAVRGKGIVYKSSVDVHEDIKKGRLVTVLNQFVGQESPLNVIYPSARYQPLRVKYFIDCLIEFQW